MTVVLEPQIRVLDEHVYALDVTRDDETVSAHTMRVPAELTQEWGIDLTSEPPLVRAAVELLVEHHGSHLPDDFTLTDDAVAYDGFLGQLRQLISPAP